MLLIISDAMAKLLVERYPVTQIVGLRGVFIVLYIVGIALARSRLDVIRPRNIKHQFLRGVCGVLSTYLFILGLVYVTLTQASAAAYTNPLFLTALAPFLLGERVGIYRWSAVIIGFTGTLVMLRPATGDLHLAMLLPATAALFGALRDLLTRRFSVGESSAATLLFTNAMIGIVGVITLPFVWTPMPIADWAFLAAAAALIGIAHYLHIEAFRLTQAATLAPYRYTTIVWASIVGFFVWGDIPDGYTIIGATIIMASGLFIFYRERQQMIKGAR